MTSTPYRVNVNIGIPIVIARAAPLQPAHVGGWEYPRSPADSQRHTRAPGPDGEQKEKRKKECGPAIAGRVMTSM